MTIKANVAYTIVKNQMLCLKIIYTFSNSLILMQTKGYLWRHVFNNRLVNKNLTYYVTNTVPGQRLSPQIKDQVCDNVLRGQGYRTA
jgi:trehalose/maltose hydrolase-like predicted phosphorylase